MTEPLPVILVVRPAAGGILSHVRLILDHCDRSRFQLTVAAPADFLDLLPPSGGAARFPLAIAVGLDPAKDLTVARRLAKLMQRTGGIAHAHGLRAGWITAAASHLQDFPWIMTAHNLVRPTGLAERTALRMIAGRVDFSIAVSEAVAAGLAGCGFARQRIRVVPNGIEIAAFRARPGRTEARLRLGVPEDAFLVGCVARLSREKGVDILLEAAGIARDCTVIVAGDGPERVNLAASAPANARLIGRVADTRDLLAAADIFVVPSREEGQGLVALEAMASNVPLIAANVGGLAEMLVSEHTALLVEPENPVALAAAISRLSEDRDLCSRMAANASGVLESRYDVKQMIASIEDIYQETRDRRRRDRGSAE